MGSAVQPELVARAKSVIREEMIRVRGGLSDFERIEKSRQIARRLFELEVFRKSEAIFFFLSLPEEVQTEDMIREAFRLNKEVFVPLVDKEEGCFSASSCGPLPTLPLPLQLLRLLCWGPGHDGGRFR